METKKFFYLFCFIFSLETFAINEIQFSNQFEEKKEKQEYKTIDLKNYILQKNPEYGEEIYKNIIKYSEMFEVDSKVIVSIIKNESNFSVHAKSPVGAVGLMQLMPGTAKAMGVNNPWNISENIMGGIKYFKECLKKTKGDLPLALASYNAGIGAVLRYKGIPPYKETKNYVNIVLKTLNENFSTIYTYDEVEFEKAIKGIFSEISFENAKFGEI